MDAGVAASSAGSGRTRCGPSSASWPPRARISRRRISGGCATGDAGARTSVQHENHCRTFERRMRRFSAVLEFVATVRVRGLDVRESRRWTPGCWRGRAEKRGQRTTRRGVRSSRSGANAERWGRPLSSASGTRALRGGGMFALLRRLAPPTTSLQCYAARQSLDSAAGEPSGFDPAASLVPLAEWVFQTEGDPLNVVTSLWPRSVPADQPGPRDRR